MKNSTAQSSCRQGEKENVGQDSQVSESSTFWFPVYEGVFEHAPLIRDAVWFFMWLIARTTREPDGRGKVLGGIPISDERPAGELGFPVKTVRRWRRMLLVGGYIEVVRTPYGFNYTLLKSKKWQNQQKRDFPKLPISLTQNGQIGHRDRPNRAERVPAAVTLIKTIQRQHKEEAEEGTAAAVVSLTRKPEEAERCLEAWEVVGIKPCGSIKFVMAWENVYGDSFTDEALSAVMERGIQHCQQNDIRVPPPFFEAKRRVEGREARDSFPTHPIPEFDPEEHAARLNDELEARWAKEREQHKTEFPSHPIPE
jgi:hypothetical protein